MKTLRKSGVYKRLPDTSKKDRDMIDEMVSNGWNYSSKKDWKEWKGQNIKPVEKKDKKETKRGKK